MHNLISILGFGVAFVASTIHAVSLSSISLDTLVTRQDPTPPIRDFGVETVHGTDARGNLYTWEHHLGTRISHADNGDLIIQYSDALLAALVKIAEQAGANCSSASISVRDLANLDPRVNDETITALPQNDCFQADFYRSLNELYRGGGAVMDVIPGYNVDVDMGADWQDLADVDMDAEYDRLYAAALPVPDLVLVQNNRQRAAVGSLAYFFHAFRTGHQLRTIWRFSFALFKAFKPVETCETDENMPACSDSDCHGAKRSNGKWQCIADSKYCECAPLVIPSIPDKFNEFSLNIQMGLLGFADIKPSTPGNPKCNGLNSIHYVIEDSGRKAINDFCGVGGLHESVSKEFNHGVAERWVKLRLDFKNQFTVSSDECRAFLTRVVDNCDGNNPDNPLNLKHGGTIDHPKGATFTVEPVTGEAVHCNGYTRKSWVSIKAALAAADLFCRQHQASFGVIAGPAGARFYRVDRPPNGGTVTMSMTFFQDTAISVEYCIDQLRAPLDNCDHNDPVNNPNDNKFGGYFINNNILFAVTPDN